MAQSALPQQLFGTLARSRASDAGNVQGELDVLDRAERLPEVERLEDEAH
jgi:hypothetical protein